jgi:hypothetical protein
VQHSATLELLHSRISISGFSALAAPWQRPHKSIINNINLISSKFNICLSSNRALYIPEHTEIIYIYIYMERFYHWAGVFL